MYVYMPSNTKIRKDRVELLKALKNMVHDQIPDAFDRADIRHLKVVEKELKKWIEELQEAAEPLKDNT